MASELILLGSHRRWSLLAAGGALRVIPMTAVSLLLATVRRLSAPTAGWPIHRVTRPTRRRASASTTTRPSAIPASTQTRSTTPKVPRDGHSLAMATVAGARATIE
jgi:hypothetical protein